MKVLIAEDDPVTRMALRAALTGLPGGRDLDVVVTADGAEAWARISDDHEIRLVLSDWMMPRLDGLELCARIRGLVDRPYIYVILLTTRSGRIDRLEGLSAGADDFLTKPLDRIELSARLTVARRILSMEEELRIRAQQLEDLQRILELRNEQLAELALTDSLTGLRNHRCFVETLEKNFALACRENLPLSVAMIDIDQFKLFNDTFGHPAGDDVLREVGRRFVAECRRHDTVARYGGEEFAVVLPMTDSDQATALCERLRATVAAGPWPLRPITASLGIASRDATTTSASQLLIEADLALYRSKQGGRNQVTHHRHLAHSPFPLLK